MRTAALLLVCLCPAAPPGPGERVEGLQEIACPGCKAKLKADAKFCTGCGEKIVERKCAGCKGALAPGAKFCTACGTKVEPAAPAPKAEPGPAAPAPPKPEGPVGQDADADRVKERLDAELRKFGTSAEQVNRAIDRGAAFLAQPYAKREFAHEEDYLVAYALIHTQQYYASGKLRQKINAFLRGDRWLKGSHVVYTAGVRALALEATRDPDLRALVRECAEYLIESQGPRGSWGYKEDVPIAAAAPAARAGEEGISVSGGEPLDEEVKGEELNRKGSAQNPRDGDNSCTQFAVLGLHAASKCGFRIPRDTWSRCLKEMEARGCGDGGWHYHGAGPGSYGSMTCAGVCTVALCRFYLGEKDYLAHPKVQSGIAWLAKNFSVKENPKSGSWPLYYLYSVERVGVFAATETIGEHRWYPLGAKHLVDTQHENGSWNAEGDAEKSTSYALLFLTRATAPVRALRRGGKGALETHVLNDTTNFHFILDASGSMHDELDGKEKFEVAKDVVEAVVKRLPEGTHVGLRVYGHRHLSLDAQADTDSELVIPIGPVKPAEFVAKVRALRCKGKTPITHSLTQAVRDFSGVDPDLEIITVLLTDGGESTRGARPPDAAARLCASRKGMKLHVVGFDIGDDDWKDQLQKTAAAGGGSYFHARRSGELLGALSLAAMGQMEYSVKDRAGKEVARGRLGDRHELPEGKYLFALTVEGKTQEKEVWVNTEATSHVSVSLSKFQKK
jgi:hypothetical protein